MKSLRDAYAGKRVLVTGHTGFKGSWLCMWLTMLGADVAGYALEPPTTPSLFEACGLVDCVEHVVGDVRDAEHVSDVVAAFQPEIVFHLAAQSIVRRSYREPVETYSTNVMGTVNVLEASRRHDAIRAVVVVTSDKCYENQDWARGYRETDNLGGRDPYASSKACTELIASAYARSFCGEEASARCDLAIATARAGNVVGGGDWAEDRLVPDCVRALSRGDAIEVRNPDAVRPWQHVFEPLYGYLLLGERLLESEPGFGGAWNFGPGEDSVGAVRDVADAVVRAWGEGEWRVSAADPGSQPYEARLLLLDSSKARSGLGWGSVWNLDRAVATTVEWYRHWHTGGSGLVSYSLNQIDEFSDIAVSLEARSGG